ncbi:S41 family peptidase [Peptoniphilus sp. MSJ-1]|uniref:S41 family peptidase n=1 Tax=Peptoniphilus ovalis TaxID=2841503 RepID=A0ABS6FEU7_9FIRM|nr:S41 family peptidase [Peptoniphilus ovalis]MBU5668706.1 S41 family peptidase [Peptoniphilus ovalis]
MNKFKKILLVLTLVFVVVAGYFLKNYGPNFGIYIFPPSVEEYVNKALRNMDNGINANTEEWKKERQRVLEKSKEFKKLKDSHDTLEEAIKVAGGKHSFIIRPVVANKSAKNIKYPLTQMLEEEILYIKLPPIMLGTGEENQKYVNTVASEIDKENYKGIVVDLRHNTGGDMYPMIASIASLLPDRTILEFKNSVGQKTPIKIKEGQFKYLSVSDKKINNVPVAVLIDKMTGSSGEITALALKNIEGVKFFGEDSAGYTSVNSTFNLYDNLMLFLTTASIVDNNGKEYLNEKIKPDVYTNNAIREAYYWLK